MTARATMQERNGNGALPARPDDLRGRPRRPFRSAVATIVIVVGVAVALVASFVAIGVASRDVTSAPAPRAARPPSPVQSAQAPPASKASAMISRVLPSVVNIRVIQVAPSSTSRVGETQAEGTGVIVSSDGVIVTNNHVVEGAVQVRVVFTDGHPTIPGTVVGTDPQHDLAVVRVDAAGLTPATLGHSNELRLGDTVYAIGFPLDLGVTVTRGIVSGLNRSVSVKGEAGVEHLVGLLQTDAAINPGNSGGPLVDASGQVVGINTAGASAAAADNVGFAIAIDDALPAIREILAKKPSQQGWLGIEAVSVDSSAAAAALGAPATVRGAAIVGVVPSSPADRAGLQPRDVIVAVDGAVITSEAALTQALSRFAPGDEIRLGVITPAGRATVDVRVGQRPPD